jgi:ABC-type Fe3+/spermidine/putrescine transport system ATPase subunit
VIEPAVLLLDEPLVNLDRNIRLRMREEIRALQKRLKIKTILVTHDQEEALVMADRIAVMNEGVIEQVGRPLDLCLRPASAFVSDFLG